MLNTFKNRSKISKSNNRLNSSTPRSNSTLAESFDSTSRVPQKSALTPPKAANSLKSTPGDFALSKPAPSSSATPSISKVETSYTGDSPVVVPRTESNPFLEPKPVPVFVAPAEPIAPEAPSTTQSAFDHFRKSDSKPPKAHTSSKAPTPTMYKPSLPEPKTMAPVKPKDMPKAPAKQLIVGSGVNVHADITQADVVLIEGTVDGTIAADCLMILDGGIFKGEATCRVAYIAGIFVGPQLITSEKLQVGSTGKITASITYNVISMESGSVVTGMLTHKPPPEPEPEPEPVIEELPIVEEDLNEDVIDDKKPESSLSDDIEIKKSDAPTAEKGNAAPQKGTVIPPLS